MRWIQNDDDIPEEIRENEAYVNLAQENRRIRRRYCRTIIAFFFLGTCNYFNLIAITTAAADIIDVNIKHDNTTRFANSRRCTEKSTAVVVLSWVIPATLISLIIPFLPMLVNFRIFFCIFLSVVGYLLIGLTVESLIPALLGVVMVSVADVITEATHLQYTNYFHGNVIAAFASGSGVAGLVGSLAYTIGVINGFRNAILGLIAVPIMMGIFFWLVLPVPNEIDKQAVIIQRAFNVSEIETPWDMLRKKYHSVPKVLYKYIAPLGCMFLLEYFINQGTFELQKTQDTLYQKNFQYHWFQVSYQIGVFISRSSIYFIYFRKIWILTCLQIVNVVLFTTSAIYWYIENFWILFVMAFEEGLIGGAAYANTFVKIGREEEEEEKQFITSLTCFGNNAGVMIASLLAILLHDLVCTSS